MAVEPILTDAQRDSRRAVREVGVLNPNPGDQHRARRLLGNRATLPSIIGVEAAVFLAIVYTLARGPADLRQSSWAWAALSLLFFAMACLRWRATAWAQDEGRNAHP